MYHVKATSAEVDGWAFVYNRKLHDAGQKGYYWKTGTKIVKWTPKECIAHDLGTATAACHAALDGIVIPGDASLFVNWVAVQKRREDDLDLPKRTDQQQRLAWGKLSQFNKCKHVDAETKDAVIAPLMSFRAELERHCPELAVYAGLAGPYLAAYRDSPTLAIDEWIHAVNLQYKDDPTELRLLNVVSTAQAPPRRAPVPSSSPAVDPLPERTSKIATEAAGLTGLREIITTTATHIFNAADGPAVETGNCPADRLKRMRDNKMYAPSNTLNTQITFGLQVSKKEGTPVLVVAHLDGINGGSLIFALDHTRPPRKLAWTDMDGKAIGGQWSYDLTGDQYGRVSRVLGRGFGDSDGQIRNGLSAAAVSVIPAILDTAAVTVVICGIVRVSLGLLSKQPKRPPTACVLDAPNGAEVDHLVMTSTAARVTQVLLDRLQSEANVAVDVLCILRFLDNVSKLTNAKENLQSVSHTTNQARPLLWRLIYQGLELSRRNVNAELANNDPRTKETYHNPGTGVLVLNKIYRSDDVLRRDKAILAEALCWWQSEMTRLAAAGPAAGHGHERSLYTDLANVFGCYARLASAPV